MKPLAFRATYSDWKLVKTRGVVQIVMEVPIADYQSALDVLGGMPDPARENWFAVAPLKIPPDEKETKEPDAVSPQPSLANGKPEKAKRPWRDTDPMTQAGIRCNEVIFAAFLKEVWPGTWRDHPDAAEAVRSICGVPSRKLLNTVQEARVLWHQLDEQFQAWKALEHA